MFTVKRPIAVSSSVIDVWEKSDGLSLSGPYVRSSASNVDSDAKYRVGSFMVAVSLVWLMAIRDWNAICFDNKFLVLHNLKIYSVCCLKTVGDSNLLSILIQYKFV